MLTFFSQLQVNRWSIFEKDDQKTLNKTGLSSLNIPKHIVCLVTRALGKSFERQVY